MPRSAIYWLKEVAKVAGLTIGFATVFMILSYLASERSYERWIPGSDTIAVVAMTAHIKGQDDMNVLAAPYPLGEAAVKNIAALENYSVQMIDDLAARLGNRTEDVKIAFVDPNFFKMLKILPGLKSAEGAEPEPGRIIVTTKFAKDWFGMDDAVGKTLTLFMDQGPKLYEVETVLDKFPGGTHLSAEIYAPLNRTDFPDSQWKFENWGSLNSFVYFEIPKASDLDALSDALTKLFKDKIIETLGPDVLNQFSADVHLISLTDLRAQSGKIDFNLDYENPGNPEFTKIISLIGLIVLAIALINYINIAVLGVDRKSREIGIRKILGAPEAQIAAPFVGDTLIHISIAVLLALLITPILAQPLFGIDKPLTQLFSSSQTFSWLAGLTVMSIIVISLCLSLVTLQVNPVSVLSGKVRNSEVGNWLRYGLIFFQFTASAALIVVTVIIFTQTRYLQTKSPGYDVKNLVAISEVDRLGDDMNALINALQSRYNLETYALSYNRPGNSQFNSVGIRLPDQQDATPINREETSADFFGTIGTPLLAGREMTKADSTEQVRTHSYLPIIINEAAMDAMGFSDAPSAIGQKVMISGLSDQDVDGEIIGVAQNIKFRSNHSGVTPAFYYDTSAATAAYPVLWLRLPQGETLASLQDLLNQNFPDQPLKAEWVSEALLEYYKADRTNARRLILSSTLALLLAAIGAYGLVAQNASRRSHELAIRRVFGASQASLAALLLSSVLLMVSLATLLGALAGHQFGQIWLADFKDRAAMNGMPYITAFIVLILIVLVSSLIQVLRAANVRPAELLRQN